MQSLQLQPSPGQGVAVVSPEKEHSCHPKQIKMKCKAISGSVKHSGSQAFRCSQSARRHFSAGIFWACELLSEDETPAFVFALYKHFIMYFRTQVAIREE